MNPVLQVKLNFRRENNTQKLKGRGLRSGGKTTTGKIDSLITALKDILRYYSDAERYIEGVLVDVCYNDIIAKSNRIRELLKSEKRDVNETVVGARFSDAPEGEENHIITHYVDEWTVRKTIDNLEAAKHFLSEKLSGEAVPENFNELTDPSVYNGYGLSKSRLRDIIVDCSVLDSFSIPTPDSVPQRDTFLVTLYRTELTLNSLLERLGIDRYRYWYTPSGDDTISVTGDLFEVLMEKVPYLISMVSSDLNRITVDDIRECRPLPDISIPSPGNEPVIGVIDTIFDESVYFNAWVENREYLDDVERLSTKDDSIEHGTEVTSIIVDGPRMNPWLDDGCGRFRVRHFGVCKERISTVRLIRKIREIVTGNPDIHVWNLSLGSDDEVSKNFISYDGAFLDELQAEKNVIFVISGTNDNRTPKAGTLRVGPPADSLNSIVVNSVRRDGRPASYSRKGRILSFFSKPDVSYYGGDFDERLIAYSPLRGEEGVFGTSFAAPWISRKMCYLIDIVGLPREVAKALLIDSAAGWEFKRKTYRNQEISGYGVVPVDVRKILSSEADEIKFVVYGSSEAYKTVNYSIPVPKDSTDKYPFAARAMLCYFPPYSRAQGVDYTDRELSLSFGRVTPKGTIEDINDNIQDDGSGRVNERESRKAFRKWENTKFISKTLKPSSRPLKSYDERLWGLSVVSQERLTKGRRTHLNFGAVITLKEINGVNRIEDFIKACILRGWIVNELDVQNRIEVYNTNQEDIVLE